MLHIIATDNHVNLNYALEAIDEDDDVVILIDILALPVSEVLNKLCTRKKTTYAISNKESRWGSFATLPMQHISYERFVELSAKNSPIHTWY